MWFKLCIRALGGWGELGEAGKKMRQGRKMSGLRGVERILLIGFQKARGLQTMADFIKNGNRRAIEAMEILSGLGEQLFGRTRCDQSIS